MSVKIIDCISYLILLRGKLEGESGATSLRCRILEKEMNDDLLIKELRLRGYQVSREKESD